MYHWRAFLNDFAYNRNGKSREKVGLPWGIVALKYAILWQFKSQKYYKDLYGKKSQSRKRSPQTFVHVVNFSKNVPVNHTILLLWLEWTNLSHVLAAWSAFHALFAWSWHTMLAKDHGLFYPQINEVGKSNHMVCTVNLLLSARGAY